MATFAGTLGEYVRRAIAQQHKLTSRTADHNRDDIAIFPRSCFAITGGYDRVGERHAISLSVSQPNGQRPGEARSRARTLSLFTAATLVVGIILSQPALGQSTVSVTLGAKRTFLHRDDAEAAGPITPPVLDLVSAGFAPGTTLEIGYEIGPAGFSFGGAAITDPGQIHVLGIFSGSSTLLTPNFPEPVVDAIDAGIDYFSDPTFWFREPTDITEDFQISPHTGFNIEVPAGATHLFFGISDPFVIDNQGEVIIIISSSGGPDADGDGVGDDVDNCPAVSNPDQADSDGDGIGDACDVCAVDPDNDTDQDGICAFDELGALDNCPDLANPDQIDTDADRDGDACDADDDNDTVLDAADNCSVVVNADQADLDRDGAGDACDDDSDGDGVIESDICVFTPIGEAVNAEGCAIADLCPCDNQWKNHGAYVSCVAHATQDFVDFGLITEAERDAIVSRAGQSQCGK